MPQRQKLVHMQERTGKQQAGEEKGVWAFFARNLRLLYKPAGHLLGCELTQEPEAQMQQVRCAVLKVSSHSPGESVPGQQQPQCIGLISQQQSPLAPAWWVPSIGLHRAFVSFGKG